MKGFLAAIGFLSAIPLKTAYVDEKELPRSLPFFPLVGLILGLIPAAGIMLMTALNFNGLVSSVVAVITLIILTGGLHLDGLADTCDAVSSGKDKEGMLKIMRDPHIGTMGVIGLVSVLALKVSLISAISAPLKAVSLILMCVLSRWALVLSIFVFPYAREEGKAKAFWEGVNPRIMVLTTVGTLALTSMISGLKGLPIFGAVAVVIYLFGRFFKAKIGGMTGDTLGAANELAEVIVLFGICVIERIML